MGWDYHTYMKQPEWFIKGIREVNKIDNKVKKKRLEDQKKKSGTSKYKQRAKKTLG